MEVACLSVSENGIRLTLGVVEENSLPHLIDVELNSDEIKPYLKNIVEGIPKGMGPLLERLFPDGYYTRLSSGLGCPKTRIICSKKEPYIVLDMSTGPG